jgi:hypothetical protein
VEHVDAAVPQDAVVEPRFAFGELGREAALGLAVLDLDRSLGHAGIVAPPVAACHRGLPRRRQNRYRVATRGARPWYAITT